MPQEKHHVFRNILRTTALPVGMYLVFFLITRLCGVTNFGVGDNLVYTLKQTAMSMLMAMGLSLNMISGRWDFSIGSVAILSSIIGGNLALQWQLPAPLFLIITVLIAVVLSLVTGAAYVTLRLPIIIVTLGMLMIYESISGLVFDAKGITLYSYPHLTVFGNIPQVFIVLAVMLLLYWFLIRKTVFGYNTRALAGGQQIAVNSGINERKNTLLCFVICGVFVGVAAVLNASYQIQKPATNLSSAMLMFSAISPVIIALTLSKYSNLPIALFVSCFSIKLLESGILALGFSATLQTVISGLFLLVFVATVGQVDKLKRERDVRKLILAIREDPSLAFK